MKKMIKVPFRGPIYPKGSIMGPITTPYLEDYGTIAAMLIQHLPVIEVLPTGGEVPLNLHNYNKDNTPVEFELSDEDLSLLDESTITPPIITPPVGPKADNQQSSGVIGTGEELPPAGTEELKEKGEPNKETTTPTNTGSQNQSNQQRNNQNQQQQNRNQGQKSDDQNFRRK